MKIKTYSGQLTIICVFLLLAGGCSLFNKNNKNQAPSKLDLAKERKQKHEQLYQELTQHILKTGTTKAVIKEKFGAPDDIFQSGSSTSSLEVWTYENVQIGKEEKGQWEEKGSWESILLYFDNGRLISWKY